MDPLTMAAANALIEKISKDFYFKGHFVEILRLAGIQQTHIEDAAKILQEEGLIKVFKHGVHDEYSLTGKAILLKQKKQNFTDYWTGKESQKSLSEQVAQLQQDFWKSGIERDKRQRWQFWLTFLIATAAFILSVINFVKSILLP